MPHPYTSLGIFGGILLLGVLVYNIWTQTPSSHGEEKCYSNFNPGSGYDKPRNEEWGNEENDTRDGNYQRRRRRRVESCVICTETFEGTSHRRLHCGHTFHDNCISLWFREKRTCPTCRKPA